MLIKFNGQYEGKTYPSCTLLRKCGGNRDGFNASLAPRSLSGADYSGIEARLLADLAKIRLLGGKSSAIIKNSCEGAAGASPSGGMTTHVPKFGNLKQLQDSGTFSGTAAVSTVTITASKPASLVVAMSSESDEEEEIEQLQLPGTRFKPVFGLFFVTFTPFFARFWIHLIDSLVS